MSLFDVDLNADLPPWRALRAALDQDAERERHQRLIAAQQIKTVQLPRSGTVMFILAHCCYCEAEIAVAAPWIGKLHCCDHCRGSEAVNDSSA